PARRPSRQGALGLRHAQGLGRSRSGQTDPFSSCNRAWTGGYTHPHRSAHHSDHSAGEGSMNRLRTHHLLLFAVLSLCFISGPAVADALPRAKPEAVGLASDQLKKIEALFTKAVADKQIAGGVVLLARKGKIGYLQGIGRADADADKPMA